MAATTSSSGAHVRSTSWSEDVHPLSRAIKDHLSILTRKQESGFRKLGFLKEMYEVVEVFLTKNRKAFTGFVDVSDGFLDVLDICCMIRDVLMEIKEQVRELESSLRRGLIGSKSGGEYIKFGVGHPKPLDLLWMDAYVFKRRALSRTIAKQLKKMKKKKIKGGGDDIIAMRKVEETSFDVLVSLLMEVVNKNQNYHKQRSRSGIVSRFFKRMNQETDLEELKKLRERENEIGEMEKELECVYKKVIKMRVSLLNMLTL